MTQPCPAVPSGRHEWWQEGKEKPWCYFCGAEDTDKFNCQMCGEYIGEDPTIPGMWDSRVEVGEFVDEDGNHKIGHASCGFEREWQLA